MDPTPAWVDDDDVEAEQLARCPPKAKERLKKTIFDYEADEKPKPEKKKTENDEFSDKITPQERRKRLREHYKLSTMHARNPKWAKIVPDNEEDDALNLTRFAGKFVAKSGALPPKFLDFKLCRDPTVGYQKGTITAIKFHPARPVLITASTAGRISLFQLCENTQNPCLQKGDFFLQDVAFPKFRIDAIALFDGANSVLASASNSSFCYTYNLLNGEVGQVKLPPAFSHVRPQKVRLSLDGTYIAYLVSDVDIHIFVLKTMDHVHTFRCANPVVDFTFSPTDREVLFAQSTNGSINIWTLRRRHYQAQFMDEGCVRATCMECSVNGQFIACGSNTGIVNVYDLNKWFSNGMNPSPKPDFTFDQLTTSISWLRFSRDAQMLAMGSDVKRIAMRIGHCSSGTVFEQFPAKQEHFSTQKMQCAEFSPSGAFLAVGTNQGQTRLYRLNHFERY